MLARAEVDCAAGNQPVVQRSKKLDSTFYELTVKGRCACGVESIRV